MKYQLLTLLCIFAVNGTTIAADDTQTRLRAMEAEINGIFKLKGTGESYLSENCPKQLAFWLQAAEQGYTIAQYLLSGCFYRGKGIAKDEALAVAWLHKAAEQGYAAAQNNLGGMYLQGTGIAKDEVEAIAWYRKAAEQGDAAAQKNLGLMYLQGTGIAKDEAQAVAWFRKTAEQ